VRNFRVALAARPVDRASAHADLAESLLRAGNRAEARREALAALEIAPTYERAQDILLKLSDGAR
jgi:Tfp pilus assembly protein PilF